MVNVYLSVQDIQEKLNVSFTDESTPTTTQVEEFITLAEKDFEDEVGVFKAVEGKTEIIPAMRRGIYLKSLPITTITSVEISNGDKITPTWTTLPTTDYSIESSANGLVLLRVPYLFRQYRVVYDCGYEFENVPANIKHLVFLFAMRYMFETYLFEANGSGDTTEIIDNDVYKLVTKSSPYGGLGAINKLIDDSKSKLKGKLKTYLKN